MVDGERHYQYYSYRDILRDNGGGNVWEGYDDTDVSEADIELLKAIANSRETVVRFEGDEHYYDYYVNANDKQAMKDILAVYEYLNR